MNDLMKSKQDVLAAFKKHNVTNATEMISLINKAIGKDTIDNSDDAFEVIAEIEKHAESVKED